MLGCSGPLRCSSAVHYFSDARPHQRSVSRSALLPPTVVALGPSDDRPLQREALALGSPGARPPALSSPPSPFPALSLLVPFCSFALLPFYISGSRPHQCSASPTVVRSGARRSALSISAHGRIGVLPPLGIAGARRSAIRHLLHSALSVARRLRRLALSLWQCLCACVLVSAYVLVCVSDFRVFVFHLCLLTCVLMQQIGGCLCVMSLLTRVLVSLLCLHVICLSPLFPAGVGHQVRRKVTTALALSSPWVFQRSGVSVGITRLRSG